MTGVDDAVMPTDQGISRKTAGRARGAAREDPNGPGRKREASEACAAGTAGAALQGVDPRCDQMIVPVGVGRTRGSRGPVVPRGPGALVIGS